MKKSLLNKTLSGLIGLAIIGTASTSFAYDADSEEPNISSIEAKTITKRYLSSFGFTSPGTSKMTAVVGKARLDGENWVVPVRLGRHLPNEKGVVLVDAETGEIKSGA